jgi:hypothetical protein
MVELVAGGQSPAWASGSIDPAVARRLLANAEAHERAQRPAELDVILSSGIVSKQLQADADAISKGVEHRLAEGGGLVPNTPGDP